MKWFYLTVLIFVIVSCKKDKTPFNQPPIVLHAPENFELIATLPVDHLDVEKLYISKNGEMLWTLQEIWRSSDLGTTWYQANDAPENKNGAISSSSTFFVGVNSVFRTIDNGLNYTQISNESANDIENPYGNTLFIAGENIRKSTDFGNTWQVVYNSGNDSASVEDIQFIDENTAYSLPNTGIVAFNNVQILKTSNGGNSWQPILVLPSLEFYSFHFVNDKVGYAGAHDENYIHKLFKTTDGGETWTIRSIDNMGFGSICFFNEKEGYVASGNKIYLTRDGGATWKPVFTYDVTSCLLTGIHIYNNKVYFAFNNGTLYRSI